MKKVLLGSFALAVSALADVDPNQLVTHTELGYIQTEGNTKTETFNLDANAKKAFDQHVFNLSLDAQYAKDSGMESKSKFASELTYAYDVSAEFSVGYLVGYKQDKFSSYDSQAYTGPSVAYKVIKSDAHTLSTEAGVLYAQDNIRVDQTALLAAGRLKDIDYYSAYRLKGVYNWKIYENLKFDQLLTYRGSFEESDNYFVTSKSAITNKISDILSAGLSYKLDYVNLPGAKEYSDTTLTANIIIDY